MANELTAYVRIEFDDGVSHFSEPHPSESSKLQFDVTGADFKQGTQTFGVGPFGGAALAPGAVAVNGYLYMKNIGANNAILYENATNKELMQIEVGDVVLFRTGADFLTDYSIKGAGGNATLAYAIIDP